MATPLTTAPRRSRSTTSKPTWWWRWPATMSFFFGNWASMPTGFGCCDPSTPAPALIVLDVDDPYYGDHDDFEAVFAAIEASLPGLHTWVDERLARDGHG